MAAILYDRRLEDAPATLPETRLCQPGYQTFRGSSGARL
jgi:hypothetical protein